MFSIKYSFTGNGNYEGTQREGTIFLRIMSKPASYVAPTNNSANKPNAGRTCQDDGYPAGYTWDDAKQACVGVSIPTNNKYNVPNTSSQNNKLIWLFVMGSALISVLFINKKNKKAAK